jgi:hypothetical protein
MPRVVINYSLDSDTVVLVRKVVDALISNPSLAEELGVYKMPTSSDAEAAADLIVDSDSLTVDNLNELAAMGDIKRPAPRASWEKNKSLDTFNLAYILDRLTSRNNGLANQVYRTAQDMRRTNKKLHTRQTNLRLKLALSKDQSSRNINASRVVEFLINHGAPGVLSRITERVEQSATKDKKSAKEADNGRPRKSAS